MTFFLFYGVGRRDRIAIAICFLISVVVGLTKGILRYYYENTRKKQGIALRKSAKFAVSIPWEEFKELEAIRRKAGLSRSGFLLATFRAWKEAREKERLAREYENGYRQKPEDASIAEAMAATSAEAIPEEDWT